MQMVFGMIIAITMFLCFFSLSATMSANIMAQAKEVGILRAAGLRSRNLYRVYLYEALVLVFAGSLTGAVVGTLLSFTMVLQYSQFAGVPTAFYFPLGQLAWILCLSLLCATLSTLGPVRALLSQPIAHMISQR